MMLPVCDVPTPDIVRGVPISDHSHYCSYLPPLAYSSDCFNCPVRRLAIASTATVLMHAIKANLRDEELKDSVIPSDTDEYLDRPETGQDKPVCAATSIFSRRPSAKSLLALRQFDSNELSA